MYTEKTGLIKSAVPKRSASKYLKNPLKRKRNPIAQAIKLNNDALNTASGIYASIQPFFERYPNQIWFNIIVITGFLEKLSLDFFKSPKSPLAEFQNPEKCFDRIKAVLQNPNLYEQFNKFCIKFGFLWPSVMRVFDVIEQSADYSNEAKFFYTSAISSALVIMLMMYISSKKMPHAIMQKVAEKTSAFFEGYIVNSALFGLLSTQNYFLSEGSYLKDNLKYVELIINSVVGFLNATILYKEPKKSHEIQLIEDRRQNSEKKAFAKTTPFKIDTQGNLAILFLAYLANNFAADNQDNISMKMLVVFIACTFIYFATSTINSIFFRNDHTSSKSLFQKTKESPFGRKTTAIGNNACSFVATHAKNTKQKGENTLGYIMDSFKDCCNSGYPDPNSSAKPYQWRQYS